MSVLGGIEAGSKFIGSGPEDAFGSKYRALCGAFEDFVVLHRFSRPNLTANLRRDDTWRLGERKANSRRLTVRSAASGHSNPRRRLVSFQANVTLSKSRKAREH